MLQDLVRREIRTWSRAQTFEISRQAKRRFDRPDLCRCGLRSFDLSLPVVTPGLAATKARIKGMCGRPVRYLHGHYAVYFGLRVSKLRKRAGSEINLDPDKGTKTPKRPVRAICTTIESRRRERTKRGDRFRPLALGRKPMDANPARTLSVLALFVVYRTTDRRRTENVLERSERVRRPGPSKDDPPRTNCGPVRLASGSTSSAPPTRRAARSSKHSTPGSSAFARMPAAS
jgi:hypothetical protein